MATDVVSCPSCQARNRLGTSPPGQVPRCGRCRAALPWLVDATDADFDRHLEAPVPVLVDFWAPWCGPCRMVGPVVAELAGEHAGRLKVAKVNVDDNPRSAARHQIQGIPRLLLFRDGRVVEDVVGALPKAALDQKLRPHLSG